MAIIETDRLHLREFNEADAPALFALYQDAAIARFMGPPPASLADEVENIRTHRARYYAARGFGLWGVVLRASDALIGRCGLLAATVHDRPEVELSYLIDPTHQGQGLATEAARAVLEFATVRLGLRRVVAFIHPANVASRAVARRLGMQAEGTVRYKSFGDVDLFVWRPPDER
jgi:[ribosomal protein S5]-alanine N-acetyltransferase